MMLGYRAAGAEMRSDLCSSHVSKSGRMERGAEEGTTDDDGISSYAVIETGG